MKRQGGGSSARCSASALVEQEECGSAPGQWWRMPFGFAVRPLSAGASGSTVTNGRPNLAGGSEKLAKSPRPVERDSGR